MVSIALLVPLNERFCSYNKKQEWIVRFVTSSLFYLVRLL